MEALIKILLLLSLLMFNLSCISTMLNGGTGKGGAMLLVALNVIVIYVMLFIFHAEYLHAGIALLLLAIITGNTVFAAACMLHMGLTKKRTP